MLKSYHKDEHKTAPFLPKYLKTLDIRYNKISKLESLPITLINLWINGNDIKKLENIPKSDY